MRTRTSSREGTEETGGRGGHLCQLVERHSPQRCAIPHFVRHIAIHVSITRLGCLRVGGRGGGLHLGSREAKEALMPAAHPLVAQLIVRHVDETHAPHRQLEPLDLRTDELLLDEAVTLLDDQRASEALPSVALSGRGRE